MVITCKWNELKLIMKDPSDTPYPGVIVYVASGAPPTVTRISFLNTARLGVISVIIPAISKTVFLAEFPNAIQVDDISETI